MTDEGRSLKSLIFNYVFCRLTAGLALIRLASLGTFLRGKALKLEDTLCVYTI